MADKCDICGKRVQSEGVIGALTDLVSSNYGGRCRICDRTCCKEHINNDKVCKICQEELKSS